jgi:hypothetical protein
MSHYVLHCLRRLSVESCSSLSSGLALAESPSADAEASEAAQQWGLGNLPCVVVA